MILYRRRHVHSDGVWNRRLLAHALMHCLRYLEVQPASSFLPRTSPLQHISLPQLSGTNLSFSKWIKENEYAPIAIRQAPKHAQNATRHHTETASANKLTTRSTRKTAPSWLRHMLPGLPARTALGPVPTALLPGRMARRPLSTATATLQLGSRTSRSTNRSPLQSWSSAPICMTV